MPPAGRALPESLIANVKPWFHFPLRRAISPANRTPPGQAASLGCLSLKNIEQTLADREETDGGTWKKNRANERLISQRREGARF